MPSDQQKQRCYEDTEKENLIHTPKLPMAMRKRVENPVRHPATPFVYVAYETRKKKGCRSRLFLFSILYPGLEKAERTGPHGVGCYHACYQLLPHFLGASSSILQLKRNRLRIPK